jgi:hypothetical protein
MKTRRRGGARSARVDFYLRADYVLGSTGPSYAPAAFAFVSARERESANAAPHSIDPHPLGSPCSFFLRTLIVVYGCVPFQQTPPLSRTFCTGRKLYALRPTYTRTRFPPAWQKLFRLVNLCTDAEIPSSHSVTGLTLKIECKYVYCTAKIEAKVLFRTVVSAGNIFFKRVSPIFLRASNHFSALRPKSGVYKA